VCTTEDQKCAFLRLSSCVNIGFYVPKMDFRIDCLFTHATFSFWRALTSRVLVLFQKTVFSMGPWLPSHHTGPLCSCRWYSILLSDIAKSFEVRKTDLRNNSFPFISEAEHAGKLGNKKDLEEKIPQFHQRHAK
jgi:hypothetical protein